MTTDSTTHSPARRAGRTLALTFLMALVGAAAGTSVATWTTGGTGSAGGKARTATGLTVSSASAPADLVPGGSGVASFTVSNPNTYAVTLTGLTWSSPTASSDKGAACTGTYLSTNTVTGQSISVAAGASGVTVTFPAALTLSSSAPDGCQGAVWTVTGATLVGSSA